MFEKGNVYFMEVVHNDDDSVEHVEIHNLTKLGSESNKIVQRAAEYDKKFGVWKPKNND